MKRLQWMVLGVFWMQLFIALLLIAGFNLSLWWVVPWVLLALGFTKTPD